MRNLIRTFQAYWLADASFVTLLATFLSTLGVLFPAIVIARLVGLASSQR